jgi:hypothetical protein
VARGRRCRPGSLARRLVRYALLQDQFPSCTSSLDISSRVFRCLAPSSRSLTSTPTRTLLPTSPQPRSGEQRLVPLSAMLPLTFRSQSLFLRISSRILRHLQPNSRHRLLFALPSRIANLFLFFKKIKKKIGNTSFSSRCSLSRT